MGLPEIAIQFPIRPAEREAEIPPSIGLVTILEVIQMQEVIARVGECPRNFRAWRPAWNHPMPEHQIRLFDTPAPYRHPGE